MNRIGVILVLLVVSTAGLEAQTFTTSNAVTQGRVEDSVAIFIDGNARTVFGQGEQAANASGTLGISRWGKTLFLSAQISVAAKSDTVSSGYGASLLTPASGAALNSGLINLGLSDVLPWGLVLKSYLSVSTHTWRIDNPDPLVSASSFDVPIGGISFGVGYPLVDGHAGGKKTAVDFYAAYSGRRMFGDLANSSRDDLKMLALGTTDETFHGFESGLNLQYGSISAGLIFYFFDADVNGLTDGQVAAGVSLTADLIRDVLRE